MDHISHWFQSELLTNGSVRGRDGLPEQREPSLLLVSSIANAVNPYVDSLESGVFDSGCEKPLSASRLGGDPSLLSAIRSNVYQRAGGVVSMCRRDPLIMRMRA